MATSTAATSTPAVTPTATAASATPPDIDAPEWQTVRGLDEAVEHGSGGIDVAFSVIRFGDLADGAAGAELDQIRTLLQDDTTGVVILHQVKVTNASGEDVNFYPDQGTLLIGPHQLDAAFISPSFTNSQGSILDGAVVTHDIMFETSVPVAELVAVGAGRFTVSAATRAGDFLARVGDGVDVRFSWQP